MHEYGLVQQLLMRAEQAARAHEGAKVVSVTVSVGALAGVEPELLVRAWDTFRERTACEGAPLHVRPVAARWECPKCRAEIPKGKMLRCPDCEAPARLVEGDDLVLERLELEVPDV
jgi:hydrogenase nickel incorporation protein HypA/HybF